MQFDQTFLQDFEDDMLVDCSRCNECAHVHKPPAESNIAPAALAVAKSTVKPRV